MADSRRSRGWATTSPGPELISSFLACSLRKACGRCRALHSRRRAERRGAESRACCGETRPPWISDSAAETLGIPSSVGTDSLTQPLRRGSIWRSAWPGALLPPPSTVGRRQEDECNGHQSDYIGSGLRHQRCGRWSTCGESCGHRTPANGKRTTDEGCFKTSTTCFLPPSGSERTPAVGGCTLSRDQHEDAPTGGAALWDRRLGRRRRRRAQAAAFPMVPTTAGWRGFRCGSGLTARRRLPRC